MKLYKFYKHSPQTTLILTGLLFLFLVYEIISFLKEGAKGGFNTLGLITVVGYVFLVLIKKYFPESKIAKKIAVISILWLAVSVISLIFLFFFNYQQLPKQDQLKSEDQTEKVLQDETADWKTYKNEELGYEVRYPGDWITAPAKAFRYFYPRMYEFPSEVIFTISITATNPTSPFQAFGEREENLQEILIEGKKIYWKERGLNQTSKIMDYYLLNSDNSQIAYFSFSVIKENKYSSIKDIQNIFDQMLSTFRFLE